MKLLWKIVRTILIGIWLVAAIFVTVCLISYNDYGIAVINKHSFLVIDNDEMEPDYNKNDLIIVKREKDANIDVGEKVFFYNGSNATEYLINLGEVTNKVEVTSTETTFDIDEKPTSGEYVIGSGEDATVIPNIGLVYGVLTSRWGFMFLVILPTLFGIVYEVILIVEEAKKNKKEASEE